MPSRSLSTSSSTRQEALMARHAMLSEQIEDAQRKPSTNDFFLRQLKKQKLMLKEKIESIA